MPTCNIKAITLQIVIINPAPRNVHSKEGIISTVDVIIEIIQPMTNINSNKGKFFTKLSPPINTSLKKYYKNIFDLYL